MDDAFHPELRQVRAGQLTADTAQTRDMQRFEAISGTTVGSAKLWMGQTHVQPGARSADHHHGEAETAIFVLSGNPEFVFLHPDSGEETRIRASAGDYIFVPPFTPHREENNDPHCEAVVVLARSTQEAIVVNLPSLGSH